MDEHWEKINIEQSPKLRYLRLQEVYGLKESMGATFAIFGVLVAGAYIQRADALSLFGGILAVLGVWSFRRAYRDRINAAMQLRSDVNKRGESDQKLADELYDGLLKRAENVGAILIGVGTIISSGAGLVGHMLGWVN